MTGGLVSCSSQVKAGVRFLPFRVSPDALLKNGVAYAPKGAPAAVKRAIAAGNRLQGTLQVEVAMRNITIAVTIAPARFLRPARSRADEGLAALQSLLQLGKKGEGRWITIYIRNGHVFMTIAA